MSERYLKPSIEQHLNRLRQMVFLMGPRQVGKTTLAKSLLEAVRPGQNYLNWDMREHRGIFTDLLHGKPHHLIAAQDRMVFDEIHKYKRWKNALKGLFDVSEPRTHWMVTGSASLNVYRKGQDSLLGRAFTYHLHPFSLRELQKLPPPQSVSDLFIDFQEPKKSASSHLEHLMQFGGFPEPLHQASRSFHRQWLQSRLDRLVNQDLAQTENLRNLSQVEELMRLLPHRVGSALSYNSLREDLEIHFATAKHWVSLLERVFYGYLIKPYSMKKSRLIKKEPKWYLWDWSEVENEGAKFENLVASHLLKCIHYFRDTQGEDLNLQFIKDRAQNEVDFVVTDKRKPLFLVECKLQSQGIPKSLVQFTRLLGVHKAFSISLEEVETEVRQIEDMEFYQMSAKNFLTQLV